MRQYILLFVAFLAGGFVSYLIFSKSASSGQVTNMPAATSAPASSLSHNHSEMTMDDMVDMLKGKSGDEFDKAFLQGMIPHHEGAIDMAELARQYAGHSEIKQMAEDIISTQADEISLMKSWQKEWKY